MCAKKVGVLGSGEVSKTLATGFIKHGYEVMIGTSDNAKLADWQIKNTKGKVGNFSETAAFGDIVVLAVKGTAAVEIVNGCKDSLAGKTVMDTTNPIAPAPPVNGVLKYFTSLDDSLMERLQAAAPSANFVKAFSIVGNTLMVNPVLPGGRATMFTCGNNEDAKREAASVLDLFGWDVEDLGKAEAARAIEPLCMLWCIPGFLHNQWSHALKLVKA
ncbi:MAG TPA: NAD(P)-binding domain-containing protein [Chryseolinea sp.]|nr:NAD(P)-binding domain-containing protein [Chryseolinea sp.]